jgi:hypothetical protein
LEEEEKMNVMEIAQVGTKKREMTRKMRSGMQIEGK